MVPVRYAKIQVVRSNGNLDDDWIMADGNTDAAGKYDVTFVNDKPESPGSTYGCSRSRTTRR